MAGQPALARAVAEDRRAVTERADSESFALTVLQQGAAIGLGKYFGGKYHAWKTTRELLAQSRLGEFAELHAYIAAREEFFQQAEALRDNPSPDPASEQRLLALNEALNLQEQTLLAAHATENGESSVREPAPAPSTEASKATPPPTVDQGLAARIAAEVPDARYVSGGAFEVEIDGRRVRVPVRRTTGPTRVVHGNAIDVLVIRTFGDHSATGTATLHALTLEDARASPLVRVANGRAWLAIATELTEASAAYDAALRGLEGLGTEYRSAKKNGKYITDDSGQTVRLAKISADKGDYADAAGEVLRVLRERIRVYVQVFDGAVE